MAGGMETGGWRGSRWRKAVWGGAAGLLLLPAALMLVTDGMAWGPEDFLALGLMLGAACGAFELAARASGSRAYRAGAGLALGAAFLLVWINLAVGVIGDEGNPLNLLFAGVLAVGVLGAALARLRPEGMARALVAMAVAQAVVAAVALAVGSAEAVVLTVVFAGLWLAAAGLFRVAARAA